MILTKIAYDKNTLDNIRTDAEYNVEKVDKFRIGHPAWFSKGNTLYHTEPLIKVTSEYLKSRNCKYIMK